MAGEALAFEDAAHLQGKEAFSLLALVELGLPWQQYGKETQREEENSHQMTFLLIKDWAAFRSRR